jgi:hypothetical protein
MIKRIPLLNLLNPALFLIVARRSNSVKARRRSVQPRSKPCDATAGWQSRSSER